MSNYVTDPNDSTKQVAGSLPDNAYDRASVVTNCTLMKKPNAVTFTQTPAKSVSLFFGSSASFAALGTSGQTDEDNYVNFGKPTAGTTINISPTAVSGSAADIGKVVFIYKSGLSGGGA
tara:strand:- start:412 stop:768 length:357 start_codon:yes stop_codon:yes gene_type:complete